MPVEKVKSLYAHARVLKTDTVKVKSVPVTAAATVLCHDITKIEIGNAFGQTLR